MRRKSMLTFLWEHRKEIDAEIERQLPGGHPPITNHERRLWVLNHEPLYLLARSKGVRI